MAPPMRQATVAATASFLARMVTHREESAAEASKYPLPAHRRTIADPRVHAPGTADARALSACPQIPPLAEE